LIKQNSVKNSDKMALSPKVPVITVFHPQPDEHGNPVAIVHPSLPTALCTWNVAGDIATLVPLGELPPVLHDIPFDAWSDAPNDDAGWNAVAGQTDIDEPAFTPPANKAAAAGVVIEEADGRIWIVAPSNWFGGYQATFPKGRVDPGVNLQATAIREAFEESGLKVAITDFLVDSERTQTYTRYYLARRVGGHPAMMGWETQAVHLVPLAQLAQLAIHPNDTPVIAALVRMK
jgi:8-oxo-dGTP pyrophosphatase MutT (NUDIX family)